MKLERDKPDSIESAYSDGLEAMTFSFCDLSGAYAFDLVVDNSPKDSKKPLVNLKMLASSDPMDRKLALFQLFNEGNGEELSSSSGAERAFLALHTMALYDPDLELRLDAIKTIAGLKDPSSLPVLDLIFKAPLQDPPQLSTNDMESRRSCYVLRAQVGSPAYPVETDTIKSAVLNALESFPLEDRFSEKKLIALIKSRSSASSEVREAALNILVTRATDKDAGLLSIPRERLVCTLVEQSVVPDYRFWQQKFIKAANEIDSSLSVQRLLQLIYGRHSTNKQSSALLNLVSLQESAKKGRTVVYRVLSTHPKAHSRKEFVRHLVDKSLLIKALKDCSSGVRKEARKRLGRSLSLNNQELKELTLGLYSSNHNIRRDIIAALSDTLNCHRATPAILNSLCDRDAVVRKTAVEIVKKIPREIRPYIARIYCLFGAKDDRYKLTGLAALEAACNDGLVPPDATRRVSQLVKTPALDYRVGVAAIQTLFNLGDISALRRLRDEVSNGLELKIDQLLNDN